MIRSYTSLHININDLASSLRKEMHMHSYLRLASFTLSYGIICLPSFMFWVALAHPEWVGTIQDPSRVGWGLLWMFCVLMQLVAYVMGFEHWLRSHRNR